VPSLPNARIDQLGERLRLDPVSAEDLVLLQELIAEFDGPMAAVQGRLSQEVSIETTSRLKTRDTLVDKLRRQRTRLSTVQDIAGCGSSQT
jgi:ppGpp synthetase/RelA/SpoT-type nucleotidyltranferase